MGSELIISYYNKMHPEKEPTVMFKERMFSSPIVMYVRKDPSLVAQVNLHVRHLESNGLLNYWKETSLDAKKRENHQKVPQKLTTSQLEAIFYICVVLYGISTLVFVIEIIVWKIQRSSAFTGNAL